MKNLNLEILKPHLISLAIILVLTIVSLLPLFQGKKMGGHDVISHKGMSKEVRDFRDNTGEEALWTDRMFSGMPTFNISLISGGNLVKHFDKVFRLGLPTQASYLFLAMIGFYFLLVTLKCSSWLSLAGAIGYGFCSYVFIIFAAGHNSKAHAMGYIAPIICAFIMVYKGKRILGAALFALIFSLQLYANHYQVTYYTGIALIVMGAFELADAIKNKTLPDFSKSTALLVLAGAIAILPNTTRLWGTYDYGKETIRGGKSELTSNHKEQDAGGLDKSYAYAWSYGKMESFNIMIPNFAGGTMMGDAGKNSKSYEILEPYTGGKKAEQIVKNVPMYFGDQSSTSGPVYIGAIIVFLFLLGALLVPGKLKWSLVTITILSILLALGKNLEWFSDIFFYNFPMYNKFRTPSMILILAEVTMPLLGILGVKALFDQYKEDTEGTLKKLYIAVAGTAGIALFFILTKTGFDNPVSPYDSHPNFKNLMDVPGFLDALKADRVSAMVSDAWRSIALILAAAGLLWAVIKDMLNVKMASIVLVALITFDLWQVDTRYIDSKRDFNVNKKSYDQTFKTTKADQQVMADTDPHYRVLNLAVNTFNDASTSFYHNHTGGYHAAKLVLYQDLIEKQIGRNNRKVWNMLNTKYLISNTQQGPIAQRNPEALGNAWLIKNLKWVPNADEEMNSLNTFDPANEVVSDIRYKSLAKAQTSFDANGSIKYIHDEDPRIVKYEFDAAKDQFVVFSEVWYKGNKDWKAYIDGEYVDHIRVNYVLRGMNIPAGKHNIEFKFEPKTYYTGEIISLIGSILLLAFLAYGIWVSIKNEEVAHARAE